MNIQAEKRKIQIEIINDCIRKSKNIIIANAIKQSIRNAQFFISRFSYLLPTENYLKEVNTEVDNKIWELKRHISIALRNIIGNRLHIIIDDLFWFSVSDLKYGYVLLYPHAYTKFADYVLFLVEARDTIDGTIYYPGDIMPFRQVNHILTSIKGLTEKDLGIGFVYATKSELLTEISTLKSILKSKIS